MAETATKTITSAMAPVVTGSGKSKLTSYIATKVTGPVKDAAGLTSFLPEIVQYDKATGGGQKTIGSRDAATGKITWNDNASAVIKANTDIFKKASNSQMLSIESALTSNASEKVGLNKASGSTNQQISSGNGSSGDTSSSSAGNSSGGGSQISGEGEGRKSYSKSLCYPTTLKRTQQDTLRISVLKHKPSKMKGLTFEKRTPGKAIGAVTLPIPGGVGDKNATAWGQGTMTPVQIATSNAVKSFLTEDANAAMEEAKKSLGVLQKNPKDVKTGLAAMFTNQLTGTKDILARTEGAVLNPNMELLFSGPSLRSFTFSWKLSPRDEKESMVIMRIIRMFKQSMAAKTTKSQLFLKAPNTYKLQFVSPNGMKGTHRFLPKVKECAMIDFGVNYTPDGSYMTYDNSSMVSYEMAMSFQEIEPIYNSDYTELDGDRDQSIGY